MTSVVFDDVDKSDAAVLTAAAAAAATAKMAELSGSQLSEEKRGEPDPIARQRRPWGDLHMSGKIGLTATLPETLGFYDIDAVRREHQEQSAGKRDGRTPTSLGRK